MRISDWSSDVCSSDLQTRRIGLQRSASDQDARVQRAFKMGVRARAIAGDPAARPVGERDAPVERGRELQGPEWPAARRTRPPGRHPRARFVRPERKSTSLHSRHQCESRIPSSALKNNKQTYTKTIYT